MKKIPGGLFLSIIIFSLFVFTINITAALGAGPNLVQNPDLETANGTSPAQWTRDYWGRNSRIFTYPVAGHSGNGARTQITSYINGDAKWAFSHVPVAPGIQYTFSDYYKSNVSTVITVEYKGTDGTLTYEDLAYPGASADWKQFSTIVPVPPGIVSMTVFHLIKRVGTLDVDDYSVTSVTGTTTPPPPPTPSPAPTPTPTPPPPTPTPTPPPPTPSPTPPPTTGNLLPNSGFETVSTSNPNLPQSWNSGSYGGAGNVPTFTYPVTNAPVSDISSGKAVRVSYSTYAGTYNGSPDGGDAKWYFTPIPVVAGRQYNFSDSYISDATTTLTAAFCSSTDPNCLSPISYGGFINLPKTPTNVWKTSSAVFGVPTGAAYMTVYHVIHSAGTLTIDNASVTAVPPPTGFSQGFVSLSFDDGYIDHSTTVKPILDAANMKATFYIISHLSGFGIQNPNLEQGSINSPTGWLKSGSVNATYTYPVTGHTGNAAQVSSAVSGSNATWYFIPMSVFADENYTYSDWYKSTATSNIYIQITTTGSATEYINSNGDVVDTKVPFATLGTSANWTKTQLAGFYVPEDAKSVTVLHSLTSAGTLAIDDVLLGAFTDFMTPTQILALQTGGQEIGGHTQTHPDLTTLTQSVVTAEISGGRQDLISGNASPLLSLAYPFGRFNQTIEGTSQSAGYIGARTITPGFNGKNTDKYALLSQSVNADTTVAQVQAWINQAVTDKTWLILTFHQIESQSFLTANNLAYGSTPQTLQAIVNYLKANNILTHTVSEGISLMN